MKITKKLINLFHNFYRKISKREEGTIIFRKLNQVDSYFTIKTFDDEFDSADGDDDMFICDMLYQCLLRNDLSNVTYYVGATAVYFKFDDYHYGICELSIRKHGMYSIFKIYNLNKRYDFNFLGDIEKTHPLLAKELSLLVDFVNYKLKN